MLFHALASILNRLPKPAKYFFVLRAIHKYIYATYTTTVSNKPHDKSNHVYHVAYMIRIAIALRNVAAKMQQMSSSHVQLMPPEIPFGHVVVPISLQVCSLPVINKYYQEKVLIPKLYCPCRTYNRLYERELLDSATVVPTRVPLQWNTMTTWRRVLSTRVTLYTAGHLHTAVPHCSHSRAPIVHTAVPR